MDTTNAPVRARIVDLLRSGKSDDEIIIEVWGERAGNFSQCRHTILLARDALEIDELGGPGVKYKGPWPVSYVRNTGERVFRVAPGHDVPEGSLGALGFKMERR
ncbi:MAG: hypothetical protein KGZ68_10950 [Dechloromonas sp.]|nr:hypothetical protein [Dechloromonas sp.]